MLPSAMSALCLALLRVNVSFPTGPGSAEQIILRWIHIVAGIIWLGFLYFLVLAGRPMLNALDPATRAKVFPELRRGAWWLRWGALVTWLAGFRYFMILSQTDAAGAGRPNAWAGWMGIWFGCWVAAFAIEMALIRSGKGVLGNPFIAVVLVLFLMAATSWLVLSLLAQPGVSNRTLSISVGGGLGTVLLFNVWGIVWRCQKRLFAWTRALAEDGTPMPPEAAELGRIATLTMQISFWLSLPLLFFMAAAAHYPFLSGG
jgi:uncharacterized membrane protein